MRIRYCWLIMFLVFTSDLLFILSLIWTLGLVTANNKGFNINLRKLALKKHLICFYYHIFTIYFNQ